MVLQSEWYYVPGTFMPVMGELFVIISQEENCCCPCFSGWFRGDNIINFVLGNWIVEAESPFCWVCYPRPLVDQGLSLNWLMMRSGENCRQHDPCWMTICSHFSGNSEPSLLGSWKLSLLLGHPEHSCGQMLSAGEMISLWLPSSFSPAFRFIPWPCVGQTRLGACVLGTGAVS